MPRSLFVQAGAQTGLSAIGARMSLPMMIEPCASKRKSARAKIDNPAPNKKFCKGRLCVREDMESWGIPMEHAGFQIKRA
jgi:hypothetical protein